MSVHMKVRFNRVRALVDDKKAISSLEYAVLAAGVVVAVAAGALSLGDALSTYLNGLAALLGL